MEEADNVQMRRSISMPVKPRPIEPKSLKRSEEKEKINDSRDYYPESPIVERRKKYELSSNISRSANNVPCTSDWVGSTIELNLDSRYNNLDHMSARRRHHRIIEKVATKMSISDAYPKSRGVMFEICNHNGKRVNKFIPQKCVTSTSSNINNTITPASTNLSLEQSDVGSCVDNDAISYSDTNQNNTKYNSMPSIKP